MSFKAKTVLNNDIRVFKKDINTIQDAFEALKSFVQQKYELQTQFIIQYEDEEKDLVTIGSSDDLEEAYNQAESNGTVLKLLIVPEEIGVPVYSFTTELDKSNIEKEPEQEPEEEKKPQANIQDSSSSDEEEPEQEQSSKKKSCPGKKLLQDLNNNEQFREEFITSINDFIQILKKDFSKLSEQAFEQTLKNHPNIYSSFTNEQWKKIFEKYSNKIPLLLLFNFDNEIMGQWINILIQLFNNCNYHENNNHNNPCGSSNGLYQMIGAIIPMFMGQLFNGNHGFGFPHPPPPPPPPPHHFGFGYPHPHPHHFYGGHGHGHGHRHGFHHPPPPPPPPFNPLMNIMSLFGGLFGSNTQSGHNFNHFYPPPPPPAPHGPHSFYGYGCPYKNNNMNECPYKKNECKKSCNTKLCKRKIKKEKKEKKCKMMKKKDNDEKDYNIEIIKDDITLPHKGYVLPNQVIVKTWRIKNIGKKDLPNGISLKYKGKPFNPIINGVNFNVPSLKINEECDISVVLESPKLNNNNKTNNKYKANFKLCFPDGNFFGPIFRVVFFMINNNNDDINMDEKKEEIMMESKEKEQEKEQVPLLIEQSPPPPQKPPQQEEQVLLDNNNNNNNNSSRLNEIEEMDMIDNQLKQEQQQQEQESLKLEPDIIPPNDDPEPESEPFIYQKEVDTLMSMGVQDNQYLRQLLLQHKGNMHQVLNALFN